MPSLLILEHIYKIYKGYFLFGAAKDFMNLINLYT